MSEVMNEAEVPFLTLTGQLTADARVRAYRSNVLRLIVIRVLIFIAVMLVMSAAINLYYGLPAFDFSILFSSFVFRIGLPLIILVYAVEGLWLRPRKLRKNMIELYGDTQPWETKYEFYEKGFSSGIVSGKNPSDLRLDYADLKKLKVRRRDIFLKTKTGNRFAFTRGELSPEDEQKMIDTLRERSGVK